MVWQSIVENFAAPAARRLGTASAAFVLGVGATADVASATSVVVTASLLFAVDLIFSKSNRSKFRSQVLGGLR